VRNVRKYVRRGSRGNVLVMLRLSEDDRTYRLTPALERAGYRVPPEVLNREGFIYKRIRQAIDDRAK
jgi:hypothetical protein